jgi:cyanophycinase
MASIHKALALVCMFATMTFSQGSLLLVGGGSEDYNDWSDSPYRWLVAHAPNKKIIVLNYADTTDFFSGYLPWLSPCKVTNLAIRSTLQANDSAVYWRILEHDGIFLRGGDQWQYVSLWRHTLAEQAIREVYQRGGVVGGTSAGEMILSDVVYDARLSSAQPRTALRTPLGASITLTDDFLRLLPNTILDSHFFERGRFGRLPVFIAINKQSTGREVMGIGIDANTAVGVGSDSIGEVMGSGTMTLLRFSPGTQYLLEASKPLTMRAVRFDQLTDRARFNIATGDIHPPEGARPYSAQAFSAPGGAVILDGSGSSVEWTKAGGSLQKLQGALASATDTVAIIASSLSQSSAVAVGSALGTRGTAYHLMWIGEGVKNDSDFAIALSGCGGFVFVGNSADSIAAFLNPSTLAGRAFTAQVIRGKPVALFGDDAGLAGEEGIGQMYRSIYGAYYGYLTRVGGLSILKGMQCATRLYEQSDYIDNRASSVFWSMAADLLPFGLLLDGGTHVIISGGQLRVFGSTPAILIDARTAVWASTPDWRAPGKLTPRQNGGILGATMHILRAGEAFPLTSVSSVSLPHSQSKEFSGFTLAQNYPNPFNSSTRIKYTVGGAGEAGAGDWGLGARKTMLVVYDLLGRQVATLVDEKKAPGSYEVSFDASGLASGVYFYRMTAGSYVDTKKLLLIR